jgi:hypothetical protein
MRFNIEFRLVRGALADAMTDDDNSRDEWCA